MTDPDDELANKVVSKLLRKKVTGSKHHQRQTIAGWFASDEQGNVKDVLDDLVADPNAPLQQTGRDTVQLTSMQDGKEYVKQHGGDLPWGLRD